MIDLHVDFLIQHGLFGYDPRKRHSAGIKGQPVMWHTDFPRMIEGGYTGACLGVHYWPKTSERGWREAIRQIEYVDRVASEVEGVMRVHTPAQWIDAQDKGALGVMPGIEGAHMLGGKLERVEEFARRGIAYMTLVHLGSNRAASTSWGRRSSQTEGLTSYGEDLVRELERWDVLIDVAHVNEPGVLEVCALATKPLFCTHSGARALRDHPRILTDRALDAIGATGGVVGVIFSPFFLSGRHRTDSSCILNHIEYIAERVGINHVALGSDFDGWLATIPSDMRDCTDVPRLRSGLSRRGWSAEDIEKVMRGNALRLLTRSALS